jgi:hypothetical protein
VRASIARAAADHDNVGSLGQHSGSPLPRLESRRRQPRKRCQRKRCQDPLRRGSMCPGASPRCPATSRSQFVSPTSIDLPDPDTPQILPACPAGALSVARARIPRDRTLQVDSALRLTSG